MYSRAAPGAGDVDDPTLNEEHWAYMEAFAGGMTARGPTLGPDRSTWTGSMHIVDLPDAEAAQRFAADEPYNRAGRFERHLIRRFENRLGRTVWEFPDGRGEPRFLLIAETALPDLPGDRLVVHGGLVGGGAVAALEAPSRKAVDALVSGVPGVEVHDWELGGRR